MCLPNRLSLVTGVQFIGNVNCGDLARCISDLNITFPDDFVNFYLVFNKVDNSMSSFWDFYEITDAVDKTKWFRSKFPKLILNDHILLTKDVFIFCDALIDCPIYCIVSNTESYYFGSIIGIQDEFAWVASKKISDFVRAIELDPKDAVISI